MMCSGGMESLEHATSNVACGGGHRGAGKPVDEQRRGGGDQQTRKHTARVESAEEAVMALRSLCVVL
jgi:hypothetical protein